MSCCFDLAYFQFISKFKQHLENFYCIFSRPHIQYTSIKSLYSELLIDGYDTENFEYQELTGGQLVKLRASVPLNILRLVLVFMPFGY